MKWAISIVIYVSRTPLIRGTLSCCTNDPVELDQRRFLKHRLPRIAEILRNEGHTTKA
ncbi:MAG: hypothetical protein GX837_07590 [Methanomicrobiales archaeon]|nr:hypothetical protein [Methanomicrobiales archaeon]